MAGLQWGETGCPCYWGLQVRVSCCFSWCLVVECTKWSTTQYWRGADQDRTSRSWRKERKLLFVLKRRISECALLLSLYKHDVCFTVTTVFQSRATADCVWIFFRSRNQIEPGYSARLSNPERLIVTFRNHCILRKSFLMGPEYIRSNYRDTLAVTMLAVFFSPGHTY